MSNLPFKSGCAVLLLMTAMSQALSSPQLEIHYINVGQGGSTLIVGPNGTRILYDFGNKSGNTAVVPYLLSLGWGTSKYIDYAILSHRDRDHYYGYLGLINAGFDVRVANFAPLTGVRSSRLLEGNWNEPASQTTAGDVMPIKPGMRFAIGNGAEVLVTASNGKIFNGHTVEVKNENDRSISLLIKYGEFDYILDGDLGGGTEVCSDYQTTQKDVQTHVARALISAGEISEDKGVDVLHIAHHGSESSTPARYVSIVKPEVGMISVGNPNCKYQHPRQKVIATVNRRHQEQESFSDCSMVTPLQFVFQTDLGSEQCSDDAVLTDNSSVIGGDIVIRTDGTSGYTVETNSYVWVNRVKVKIADDQRFSFPFD